MSRKREFFHLLGYAGKVSNVLVIKGNPDEDFEGDYDSKKINGISGCHEISGRTIDLEGFVFLGLGYNDSYSLKRLKSILKCIERRIDVVMMHGSRIRLVSSIQPKLIIRGGYSCGKYLINNVPSVLNDYFAYTIIELMEGTISDIQQYRIGTNERIESSSLSKRLSEKFKWMKPYHNNHSHLTST